MKTITEIKTTLIGVDNGVDEAEDWISHLEDKVAGNNQSEQQREKRILKNEYTLRDP